MTGAGEAIARFDLACEAAVAGGEGDPGKPAERAIARFEAVTGERAGVILVDTDEVVGSAHNTASMQTARTSGVDTQ